MCLAVPAKIIEIDGESATVEVGGTRHSAIVAFVEAPKIGDYVLVHAGFAIKKWTEEDVREYNEIIDGMFPDRKG